LVFIRSSFLSAQPTHHLNHSVDYNASRSLSWRLGRFEEAVRIFASITSSG